MNTVLKLVLLSVFLCNCGIYGAESQKSIDFNNFNMPHNKKVLRKSNTKLFNLNSDNMRKMNLTYFRITKFSLDDYNTFNVPGLFEQQTILSALTITHSAEKIVLHDDVFRGLRKLEFLTLEHLQLDTIPPNLFNDLEKVVYIALNSNNIKVLPTSFEFNRRLTEIHLRANPIYSEPHDRIDQLVIGGYKVRFYFANYTIHTRDTVKKLMNNGRIDSMSFETLATDFKIEDFLNMDSDRNDGYLGIEFKNYPSGYLDWNYLNTHGVPHHSSLDVMLDLRGNFNAEISLPITGEACQNCWMMKNFLQAFIAIIDTPCFYFEHSRVLLKFQKTCTNQISYFDEIYTENCVPTCKCIYNPLADQIIIDCRNRNLTEFPVIPYPVQYDYDTIYTIDLLFGNNSLSHVSFDGQDGRVLQKLVTLNFSNNRIKTFTIDPSNSVKRLNLCANPILDDIKQNDITLVMSRIGHDFSSYLCVNMLPAHHPRLDPNAYVSKTKQATLLQYLDKLKC